MTPMTAHLFLGPSSSAVTFSDLFHFLVTSDKIKTRQVFGTVPEREPSPRGPRRSILSDPNNRQSREDFLFGVFTTPVRFVRHVAGNPIKERNSWRRMSTNRSLGVNGPLPAANTEKEMEMSCGVLEER